MRCSLPSTGYAASGGRIMNIKTAYVDQHILITDNDIIFYNYYFPTGKKKCVKMDDIECIIVVEPTIRNGKWRIHGTGNFKIWFPKDHNRPNRDRIFIATMKNQWISIGFTAEDGNTVEDLLRSKKLIKDINTQYQPPG
jgi:hypothetical protein